MRSLERRSMNSIFAPLDPDERLPRELLFEQDRFRIYKDDPGWRHLASFAWPPAVILTIGLVTSRFASATVGLLAAALLFIAFAWFIFRGRMRRS
jgi:hypothetical protein